MPARKIGFLLTAVIVGLFASRSVSPSLAAAFQLRKIGGIETHGVDFAKFWFTGNQPTFSGIGLAQKNVSIKIADQTFATTIDANGEWSFTPATLLASGEHLITLTSEAATIEFTLVIGPTVPADVAPPSTPQTPVAGAVLPTLIVSSIGTSFLGAAMFLQRRSN